MSKGEGQKSEPGALLSEIAVPTDFRCGTLPGDFVCTGCGYDLGNAAVTACSECGREIREDDLVHNADQQRLVRELRRIWRRVVYATMWAFGVMGLVAILGMSSLSTAERVTVALGPPCYLLASLMIGLLGEKCALTHDIFERRLIRALWLRYALWMHLPWMAAPVLGLILAGAAMASERALTGALLFVGLGWLAAVLIGVRYFEWRFNELANRIGFRFSRLRLLILLYCIVLWFTSILAGIAVLAIVAHGIAVFFGLG